MSLALLRASGAGAPKLYVEDVFSAYLRTSTGADVVTTTGIDMTKGYMLWTKSRSAIADHAIYDSARGVTKDLVSNSTAAETTQTTGLKAVSTTGHTIGTLAKMNTSGATYVDHVFREAPKFFKPTTKVHTTGTASTVDLSSLGTVGMVEVKSTVGTSNWFTWHRSLTVGNLLYLNLTNAQTADTSISVSGTTLTIASTAPSDTYVVYAWAHDTSADGIIQCGSFIGNTTISLGWEPQYILAKNAGGGGSDWFIFDVIRGLTVSSQNWLLADTSAAESSSSTFYIKPTATGFETGNSFFGSGAVIYMAIRRPNKVPTSGTQVYNAIARTGTGAAATVSGVGFAPDLEVTQGRSGYLAAWYDRLRGTNQLLRSNLTNAEYTGDATNLTSLNMDGVTFGTDASLGYINTNAVLYINHFFKRAKGFFDIVCYTGTGVAHTEAHNLGVVPELIIVKGRSGATQWEVYCNQLANTEKLILNSTAAKATDTTAWNSTSPTSTVLTIGTDVNVNTSTATYVAYLFSSLAGVSKIGSYTGNGTAQTINCGFSTGARFVLVKASSTTGSWWVFDSVRGIVAGTDFGLQLNSTAAETTSADCIDPNSVGFDVVQEATCSLNANGVTYIYMAVS